MFVGISSISPKERVSREGGETLDSDLRVCAPLTGLRRPGVVQGQRVRPDPDPTPFARIRTLHSSVSGSPDTLMSDSGLSVTEIFKIYDS